MIDPELWILVHGGLPTRGPLGPSREQDHALEHDLPDEVVEYLLGLFVAARAETDRDHLRSTAHWLTAFPKRFGEELSAAAAPFIFPYEGEGSKWGVSDFYEDLEAAIDAALKLGPKFAWATGWFSSRKEPYSAEIIAEDGKIYCRASATDDFDTDGLGEKVIDFTPNIADVVVALDEALVDAVKDCKQKSPHLYAVGKREGDKRADWLLTYLSHTDDTWDDVYPPGDYYQWWGWQDIDWEEHGIDPQEPESPEEAEAIAKIVDKEITEQGLPTEEREALERGMRKGEKIIRTKNWVAELT